MLVQFFNYFRRSKNKLSSLSKILLAWKRLTHLLKRNLKKKYLKSFLGKVLNGFIELGVLRVGTPNCDPII